MSIESAVYVDFSGKSLKLNEADDAEPIVSALRDNLECTYLNLSGNTLGVNAAEQIGSQLALNSGIIICHFNDLFTGRMANEIGPALSFISTGIINAACQLTELDLSDNAFGPRGIVGVIELLSSPSCYSLKVLKMNNQGLGHQGCKLLVDALLKGLEDSCGIGPRLNVFSAGRNRLENFGAKQISKLISKMESLEEIYLYQNGIGIYGVEGVECLMDSISKNSLLRVLNLSDNMVKPKGTKAIAKCLQSLPFLQELMLDDCMIGSAGCHLLAKQLGKLDTVPELMTLRLDGNEIRRSAGEHLVLSLASKEHFSCLSLNANEFGPAGVDAIVAALMSHGLLGVLDVPSLSGTEEIDEEASSYYRAFDADGGDEEAEDDYDQDQWDYQSEEADSTGDTDEGSSEQSSTPFGTTPNSQFAAKDLSSPSSLKPASKFSFLSCFESLKSGTEKSIDGGSLFSGLSKTLECKANLLFPNSQAPSFSSGLFTPPTTLHLPSPTTTSSLQPSISPALDKTPSKADVDSLKSALKDCLTEPLVEARVKDLSVIVGSKCVLSEGEVDKLAASPESLVRTAFLLARQEEKVSAACLELAMCLLAAACNTAPSGQSPVSASSRAVNHILLHLAAIKPDKSSPLERHIAEDALRHQQRDLQLLRSLLENKSTLLAPSVHQTLALLLSERRERISGPISEDLDAVINVLNSQLRVLTLSSF